jgi:hypothetical protein
LGSKEGQQFNIKAPGEGSIRLAKDILLSGKEAKAWFCEVEIVSLSATAKENSVTERYPLGMIFQEKAKALIRFVGM